MNPQLLTTSVRSTVLAGLALLAAPCVRGQGVYLTSPATLATVGGNQALPAVDAVNTRWQQVHGDLLGPPRLIRGIRLRRDETVPFLPTATSQPIAVDVFVGEVDLQSVTADFAANLGPAAVQVVSGGNVQLPDWVNGNGSPNAFDLDIQFTVPFAYSGTLALVVEVRTISGNLTHIADAYAETGNDLPPLDLGQGCSAGLLPYIQNSSLSSFWGFGPQPTLQWNLSAFSSPVGLPGFFIVGAQTSPIALPGICATVWPSVDLIVPAQQIVAGPIAINQVPPIETTFPAALVGAVFTTQALSIDFTASGPTFLLSQGQQLTVAPLPPLPQPVVSLRGDVFNPLASELVYGGRILQFEY